MSHESFAIHSPKYRIQLSRAPYQSSPGLIVPAYSFGPGRHFFSKVSSVAHIWFALIKGSIHRIVARCRRTELTDLHASCEQIRKVSYNTKLDPSGRSAAW